MTNPEGHGEAQELLSEAQELLRKGESKAAVARARKAKSRIDDPFLGAFNLAGVLIDAGAELGERRYLNKGVTLLKSVESIVPQDLKAAFHYNLGNGYASIGQRQQGFGPGTKPELATAISHLDEAVQLKPEPDVRANLAGALMGQGRWVEALDEFDAVLEDAPDHHNATARKGSCLMGIHNWTDDHRGLLIAALNLHVEAVSLAEGEPVFKKSYRNVVDKLRGKGIRPYSPSVTKARSDHRWIWQKRLSLNPCPICEVESPDAFDIYPLAARLEGGRRRPSPEDLLDLVNSVCRSYAVARWMLLKALHAQPTADDHVISVVGNSDAIHDLKSGLLMAAFSQFYSVLGQIAFGLNSYYDLGHKKHEVFFNSIWNDPSTKSRNIPGRRQDIHSKLTRYPTAALSALHRLALSLERGLGRYEHLRRLRNQIEHHIVVPRTGEHDSEYFQSMPLDELKENCVLMGRLVKAAVWYFGGSILRGEQQRLKRSVRRGQCVVKHKGDSVSRN